MGLDTIYPRVPLVRHLLAASVAAGSSDIAMPVTADAATTIWSSLNSATAASGVTAPPEAVRYRRLIWVVYSSHVSAANGVSFEGSMDGTNWDVLDQYTLAATTATSYVYHVRTRHVRLVYTNSTNTITAWRSELVGDESSANPGV